MSMAKLYHRYFNVAVICNECIVCVYTVSHAGVICETCSFESDAQLKFCVFLIVKTKKSDTVKCVNRT